MLDRPMPWADTTQEASYVTRLRPRAFTLVLGVAILLMLMASVYTALVISERQRALSDISRYNVTWAVSQAGLEVARLQAALGEYAIAGTNADATQVQIRFDIVANRVEVLGQGEAGELIRSRPDLRAIYDNLSTTIDAGEKLVDGLNASNATARATAEKLIAMISPLNAPMARLAGAAHDEGANLVAIDLTQLRRLHGVFSGMQIVLMACCIGLIGVLGMNNRMLVRAHRDVGVLVGDLRRTGSELAIANDEARRGAYEIQEQNRVLQERDNELAQQNTRFDAALNNMSQALCMVGPDNRLIVCNKQFLELFGISYALSNTPVEALFAEIMRAGRCDTDMISRLWLEQLGLASRRQPGSYFTEALSQDVARDGTDHGRAIAVSHQPMKDGGWVATYSDITERRIAERQLAQAQKMEAIGNLTGGMAHDFNNLLAVISLNLESLLDRVDQVEQVREHAARALNASLRGASLISQLLAFARRQPLEPQRISVNTRILAIASLVEHTLGETVHIALDLGTDIWPVNADATRLETAIANLATNARDAMPLGGTLTITTENRSLAAATAPVGQEMEPGDYVMIEVADTGVGMTADISQRIFEPFFTTKGEGQGTGLGLSMVFGFIRQSGGHITVSSVPGNGTAFQLYLPRAEGGPVAETEEQLRAPPHLIGGSETILLVEDNEAVRLVTSELLGYLGYDVIETDNPHDALEILHSGRSIDLLFSDVVMPGGMDGFALINAAAVLRPKLKALLASGFAEFAGDSVLASANVRILGKPFRQSELASVLREILDA